MYRKLMGVAILVVALVGPMVPTAGAAPAARGPHCVERVTGQEASGELIVSAPRCYSTFEGAMAAEGVSEWGEGAASRVAARGGVGILSFTLATHYDFTGLNPAGGSTSTVGSACSGWINTSPAWNNRIGSTSQSCPAVGHFDGANLTGDVVVTFGGGGNLGAMNNRTSSIQYT